VWALAPGAVDWLRKIYLTWEVFQAAAFEEGCGGKSDSEYPLSEAEAAALVRETRVFLEPTFGAVFHHQNLVCLAADTGKKELLRALIAVGAPFILRSAEPRALSALRKVAYYDTGANDEIMSILLAAVPPPRPNAPDWELVEDLSAACCMASNQGNVDMLRLLLPSLKLHVTANPSPEPFVNHLYDCVGECLLRQPVARCRTYSRPARSAYRQHADEQRARLCGAPRAVRALPERRKKEAFEARGLSGRHPPARRERRHCHARGGISDEEQHRRWTAAQRGAVAFLAHGQNGGGAGARQGMLCLRARRGAEKVRRLSRRVLLLHNVPSCGLEGAAQERVQEAGRCLSRQIAQTARTFFLFYTGSRLHAL